MRFHSILVHERLIVGTSSPIHTDVFSFSLNSKQTKHKSNFFQMVDIRQAQFQTKIYQNLLNPTESFKSIFHL